MIHSIFDTRKEKFWRKLGHRTLVLWKKRSFSYRIHVHHIHHHSRRNGIELQRLWQGQWLPRVPRKQFSGEGEKELKGLFEREREGERKLLSSERRVIKMYSWRQDSFFFELRWRRFRSREREREKNKKRKKRNKYFLSEKVDHVTFEERKRARMSEGGIYCERERQDTRYSRMEWWDRSKSVGTHDSSGTHISSLDLWSKRKNSEPKIYIRT